MTTKGQILVALSATAAGMIGLAVYWALAQPQMNNATVAIGTLVYATVYILTVPRFERRLMSIPSLMTVGGRSLREG
jgi:hypothetical protein